MGDSCSDHHNESPAPVEAIGQEDVIITVVDHGDDSGGPNASTHQQPSHKELSRPLFREAQSFSDSLYDNLEKLNLGGPYSSVPDEEVIRLLRALRGGACPRVSQISLGLTSQPEQVIVELGEALQSRLGMGDCSTLKILNFLSRGKKDEGICIDSLSPVLSSGACDLLEEFSLEEGIVLDPKGDATLAEWFLGESKASQLIFFRINSVRPQLAKALSTPGVAPQLRSLGWISYGGLLELSGTLKQGEQWPHLRELCIVLEGKDALPWPISPYLLSPYIVEHEAECAVVKDVLTMRGRPLKALALRGVGVGHHMAAALAKSLVCRHSCKYLEELDLQKTKVGDKGLEQVALALQQGAPCSKSLLRLHLSACGTTHKGVYSLAKALCEGACPQLKFLDLSHNNLEDRGLAHLAAVIRAGALIHLRKLHLEAVNMCYARELVDAIEGHKDKLRLEAIVCVGEGNYKRASEELVRVVNQVKAISKARTRAKGMMTGASFRPHF